MSMIHLTSQDDCTAVLSVASRHLELIMIDKATDTKVVGCICSIITEPLPCRKYNSEHVPATIMMVESESRGRA